MQDDPFLLERCRAGEPEARRQVFEQTSARIYRLLLRMTGNEDDAFDLTQETFIKGFEQFDRFDGRSAVASWFYRIAVNEALQFRRRKSIGSAKLGALAHPGECQPQETHTDLKLDLDTALSELTARDRALLLLRYQENLDYKAISQILDCAEGTIASGLNRAREQLRRILRKSYG